MNSESGEFSLRTVEFFSFDSASIELQVEWMDSIKMVLDSGQFIGGSANQKFEREWQNYLSIKHAVGVGNGYDAILIALKGLDIGRGHYVAVPSHTFIATWLAVAATGATPIGIDCNPDGLMNLDDLEDSSIQFSAVIPVHMHGQMIDMKRLMLWANIKNVRVVEDCAQAHGAERDGKKAGTWGDFGAFSFYPTKNLGAIGDAGCLVTNDDQLAVNARSYANYGSIAGHKYSYQHIGVNSRLDPIQAAILSVNLKYLDTWNLNRKSSANKYLIGLKKLGIHCLPVDDTSVFHHMVVFSEERDKSRELLAVNGVKTEIHYPVCAQISFEKLISANVSSNPTNAIELSNKTLSLPISPWISESDVDFILNILSIDEVRASFGGAI